MKLLVCGEVDNVGDVMIFHDRIKRAQIGDIALYKGVVGVAGDIDQVVQIAGVG